MEVGEDPDGLSVVGEVESLERRCTLSNALLEGLFRLSYLCQLERIPSAPTVVDAPVVLPDANY